MNLNDYTFKPVEIKNNNDSGLDCVWCGCDIRINKVCSYKLEIDEIVHNPMENKDYEYGEIIYPLCHNCYDFCIGDAINDR